MDQRSAFRSPGVMAALAIAVLILILGLFFGFGRILWILTGAAILLIGIGVFVHLGKRKP